MDLLARVRRDDPAPRLADPGTTWSRRLRAGPTRSRSRTFSTSSIAAASAVSSAWRTSTISCAPTADRDEAFCARLADSLGRPLIVDREDVAARAPGRPLDRRRRADRAPRVLRAGPRAARRRRRRARPHARRSGRDLPAPAPARRRPRGLAAMHPRRGSSIRPLLDAGAPSCERISAERDIPFVDDETNDDVRIPRNRVRAELLPLLEQRFNPSIVDVLADEAELAREEYGFGQRGDERCGQVVRCRRDGGAGRSTFRRSTPPGRAAAAGRAQAMSEAAAGRPIAFADVERALDVARRRRRSFDAPGQRVERIGADVVLTGRPAGATGRPAAEPAANLFTIRCLFQGRSAWPEAGCVVSAEVVGRVRTGSASAGDGVAAVRRDQVRGPWPSEIGARATVSGRSGSAGGRSCRTSSSTGKSPASARDAVPLVVDEARPDRVGGRPRNRRGVSGNRPRASRANLET